MRVLKYVLPAGMLLFAQGSAAQMQPHRAEYTLRLGTALNAPRVGMATQDITLDCDAWHLKRDVKGEVPISSTWKFDIASALVSSAMNWRHQSPNAPSEPILTSIVGILVDGVDKSV